MSVRVISSDMEEMFVIPSVRASQILIVGFDSIRARRSVNIGSDESRDARVNSLIDKI